MTNQATDRDELARAFAIGAGRLLSNLHCLDVLVLDVRGLSPVTDYLVIGTGTSARQMRSVMDEIIEAGAEFDYRPMVRGGYEGESWLLCDMIDVVVHVFSPESRQFYEFENLWGDSKQVDWKTPDKVAKAKTRKKKTVDED